MDYRDLRDGLRDPMNYTVHGILQARTLEWIAFPFSRGSFQPKDQTPVTYISCIGRRVLTSGATWLLAVFTYLHTCVLSHVQLFATLWTQPIRLLCPWDLPSKNTRVSCYFLLQGIFLTQGSNTHLLWFLQWQVDSFTTGPSGKPFTYLLAIYISFFWTACTFWLPIFSS